MLHVVAVVPVVLGAAGQRRRDRGRRVGGNLALAAVDEVHHGHADENAVVLWMDRGAVLLHDAGYRDMQTLARYNIDYSIFGTSKEEGVMRAIRNGLYDAGIAPIHTGTMALSTAMGEAEIDRLAEAVLASLRKVAALV